MRWGSGTSAASGMGNWYSTNWEIGTGKQYSMEIEKSSHLVTDPVVVEYVNRVGQNLVKNSDSKVPFTIKVLDTDEINAMALPGGFFYVNSGLILACDSEDELAGVMAHEIAHVAAHHAAREMTKMNYMQIGSIPLMIFTQGSWIGYGIYEASQLAVPLTFLQFSREYEAEADYLGVQYAYRSGYDPQGMVSIFEKLGRTGEAQAWGAVAGVLRPPGYARPHRQRRERDCDDPAGTGGLPCYDLGVRPGEGAAGTHPEQARHPGQEGRQQADPAPDEWVEQ